MARANMEGANMVGANMEGAYMAGANMAGASYGDGVPLTRPPVQILGLCWPVIIMDTHIKIGCELHSRVEWEAFTEDEIDNMHDDATEFWGENRDVILAAARNHQGVNL